MKSSPKDLQLADAQSAPYLPLTHHLVHAALRCFERGARVPHSGAFPTVLSPQRCTHLSLKTEDLPRLHPNSYSQNLHHGVLFTPSRCPLIFFISIERIGSWER